MTENKDTSTFVVRCIGYNQRHEAYFTVGQEYEVKNGRITSDNGYTYSPDKNMRADSDPSTWYLSGWYEFEIVEDVAAPEHVTITIDDIL